MGRDLEVVILDTHAWIFYATGKRLERGGLRRIEKARKAGLLQIASVTVWEIALLAHERKLRVTQSTREWFRDALTGTEARVAALDVATAIEGARLVRTLHDPADCQIVGTALHLGVPLATRDARILQNARAWGLEVVEI
jgi:PIN domain nuclease of toxin-antitoxin system